MATVRRFSPPHPYELGIPACCWNGRSYFTSDPEGHSALIQPGEQVEWGISKNDALWSVTRLVLCESARDLIIRAVKVGEMAFVRDLPAAEFIGVKAPAGEDEDRLIAELQSCFRYKDHSKEELQKAIRLLRPAHHVLDWLQISPRQSWSIVFWNTTDRAIRVSGMIAGYDRFEELAHNDRLDPSRY